MNAAPHRLIAPIAAAFLLAAPARAADPAPDSSTRFAGEVRKNFAAWDADGDGVLEANEIDHAIASPEYRGDAAAALVALKRSLKASGNTFLLEKLAATDGEDAGEKSRSRLFAWARERIARAHRELFVTEPPRIDSIRQGKLGDCFCLAALRSMLQRDPAAIVRMIEQQPDGSYTVQVGAQKVSVPPLTDSEIALGASADDGLWPLVYEKAVGLSRIKSDAADATAWNAVTRGGSAGSMMSALTQHPIERWSCKTWREADTARRATLMDDLRSRLRAAQTGHRLITGGTGGLPKDVHAVPGIVFNHGYSVLGYDDEHDAVRLWNPHGDAFHPKGPAGLEHGYPMEHGELTVPLPELVQFFGGFAFEQ
jgi:calpain family cysteine protease